MPAPTRNRPRRGPKLPRHRPGPAGGARDRNRRETIRRLADAAIAAFLERGIAAVTIDEIVGRADMAKGSFYRYARDKADLVEQIMAPVVDDVTAALDRCGTSLRSAHRDQLAAVYGRLATELAAVVALYAPRVLLYLQEARAPGGGEHRTIHALSDRLATRTVELTRIAREHHLIRDVDPELSALTVIGAVETILFAHLRQRPVSPRATPTLIPELVELVLRGIGSVR